MPVATAESVLWYPSGAIVVLSYINLEEALIFQGWVLKTTHMMLRVASYLDTRLFRSFWWYWAVRVDEEWSK